MWIWRVREIHVSVFDQTLPNVSRKGFLRSKKPVPWLKFNLRRLLLWARPPHPVINEDRAFRNWSFSFHQQYLSWKSWTHDCGYIFSNANRKWEDRSKGSESWENTEKGAVSELPQGQWEDSGCESEPWVRFPIECRKGKDKNSVKYFHFFLVWDDLKRRI